MKNRSRFFSCAAASAIILLTVFSGQAKEAASKALEVCLTTLIPTLFPFYAAANLLAGAGLQPVGKTSDAVLRRFLGLPGAAAPALVLGLLGGYPIGASVTVSLYQKGVLTKNEAVSLSCCANNAGPAFIIGAAGLAVFHSAKVGLVLYMIHALSALLTGFVLRSSSHRSSYRPQLARKAPGMRLLPDAVFSAVKSMVMICAYVVLCFVLLAVLKSVPLFHRLLCTLNGIFPPAEALLSGILELSGGILLLAGLPRLQAMVVASFLLGWGGLCVFFQTASVLSAAGLPVRFQLRAKSLQALIAAALTCLFCAFSGHRPFYLLGFAVFSLVLLCILKIRGRKMNNGLL